MEDNAQRSSCELEPNLPPEEENNTAKDEETAQPRPVFKIPMIIGTKSQKLKSLKKVSTDEISPPESQVAAEKPTEAVVTAEDSSRASNVSPPGAKDSPAPKSQERKTNAVKSSNKSSKSAAEALQDMSIVIPYKEPQWGGIPEKPYSFEVLKGGLILEAIDLSVRSFTVFGRLASCDVKMDHPSISRHHAVVQYRSTAADEDHPAGFYLYDLDSTHGTLLNKGPVKPRSYYRLRVGHMVKFGGSSRSFILQGPDEDAEEESPLTVTEIKEKARQDQETRRQEEERLKQLKEEADAKREKEDEDLGVDWGMGDDAAEEDGFGDNPYAMDTPMLNEDLYINDPKKTLRGWFEREGYDLEYNVEEKGQAHFLCRVQLPLDTASGAPMYAEASVKGKKKEAVVACALEACRLLDRHGVLRQANHEGRHRKSKNWEDEDYYDSDEDTYLDQTGTIEKKRLQRIQRAGKEGSGVETYESLTQKHNQILLEIEQTEEILKRSTKQECKTAADDLDSLDAYMISIKSNKDSLDKKAKTRLKIQLSQLRQEEQKLRKLVNIAKPASLPVYTKPVILSPTSTRPPNHSPKKPAVAVSPDTKIVSHSAPDPEVLIANEAPEDKPTKGCSFLTAAPKLKDDSANLDGDVTTMQEKPIENDKTEQPIASDAPVTTMQEKQIEEDKTEQSIDSDASTRQHAVAKTRSAHDLKRNKRQKKKLKYDYDSTDPNYAMWLPPEGQSGDGRTNLNEKFGY